MGTNVELLAASSDERIKVSSSFEVLENSVADNGSSLETRDTEETGERGEDGCNNYAEVFAPSTPIRDVPIQHL